MTDFVDRLLGRSEVPPIRPLIPTLFEPVRHEDPDDALPLGGYTDTAAAVSDPGPVHHADRTPSTRVAEPPAVPAASRPVSTTSIERHVTDRRIEAHHHHTRNAQPDTPSMSTVESPAAVDVPATAAPSDPVRVPAPLQTDRAIAKAIAAQTLPEGSRTEAPTGPALAAHPVWPVTTRSQARPPVPDVHISIGRVEITARTPEKPPRARVESPRGPRLSLEDYLRDRAGEGR